MATDLRVLMDGLNAFEKANGLDNIHSGTGIVPFAKFLGVTERAVWYWLREQRALPGPVKAICRALARNPKKALALLTE